MYSLQVDEDMVECPYNTSHRMLRKRLQPHILKCRLNYPDVELQKCPFNLTHLIPEPEFVLHVTNCPDRKLITQYKYGTSEIKDEERPKHAPIECEENWDDTTVEDYQPAKYAEVAPVLRRPIGVFPHERKAFKISERKRLGDYSSDEEDKPTHFDIKHKHNNNEVNTSNEATRNRPPTPPPPIFSLKREYRSRSRSPNIAMTRHSLSPTCLNQKMLKRSPPPHESDHMVTPPPPPSFSPKREYRSRSRSPNIVMSERSSPTCNQKVLRRSPSPYQSNHMIPRRTPSPNFRNKKIFKRSPSPSFQSQTIPRTSPTSSRNNTMSQRSPSPHCSKGMMPRRSSSPSFYSKTTSRKSVSLNSRNNMTRPFPSPCYSNQDNSPQSPYPKYNLDDDPYYNGDRTASASDDDGFNQTKSYRSQFVNDESLPELNDNFPHSNDVHMYRRTERHDGYY